MQVGWRVAVLLIAALALCAFGGVTASESAVERQGTPDLVVEPSPSPTMTQAPSPPFFDDFEDPGSGWFTGDTTSGEANWSYDQGRYKVVLRDDDYRSSSRRNWIAGEGVYEVDVYLDGEPTTAAALIFAVSSDWQRYYAYEVRANGTYSFWRINEGKWDGLVLWTEDSAINPGSALNCLKVDWQYGQIDLYVNDVYIDTVYDDTHYRKAYLGVRGIAFEGAPETTTIYWDNYAYWPRGVPTPTPTLTPTITPTPVSRCRLPLIMDR